MKVYMCNDDYRVVSVDKAQDIIHEIETEPSQIEYACSKEDFIRLVADFMSTESDKESKLAEMYKYIQVYEAKTFNEAWSAVQVGKVLFSL